MGLNGGPLMRYFSRHHLDYFCADSCKLNFSSINDRTILIASEHNIPPEGLAEIMKNEDIVCAIINVEILKGAPLA
jgi:hypothetical protein